MVTVHGTVYRYVAYVPDEWTAQKKWPVILSLHGSMKEATTERNKASWFLVALYESTLADSPPRS
jgi:poly(3-hydroxybutyrate) depolymerase